MSRLHPGPRKQLVLFLYWTRNRACPNAVRSGQSVIDHKPGTWSSQECASSPVGTRLAKVAIMQLTTHAATWWSNAASSRLRPPPPEKPKVPRRAGSTPSSAASTRNAARSSESTAPANVWPSAPAALANVSSCSPDAKSNLSSSVGRTPCCCQQRVLGIQQRGESRGRTGEIESPTAPGEGVVHENDMAATRELVRRAATGVVRGAEPGRPRTRARTEVDQLLGTNGPHAAVTMHAENSGQAAPNVGWAQQPGARVGSVAHRPAQSADQDAIAAHAALVMHCRTVGGPSQAEHPAQRRTRRVGADVGLSRSHRRRPVLVARDGIRLGTPRLLRRCGQRTAWLSCNGPALPRLSILGRRKIAWPGGRSFSKSHIRCQACRPSSVTGTDAVVSGGVR